MASGRRQRKRHNTIGERVKHYRELGGWSLSTFADRANVDRQTIHEIETQGRRPHRDTLRKIAKGLGVGIAELENTPITAEAKNEGSAVVGGEIGGDARLAGYLGELLKAINELSPEMRQSFVRSLITIFTTLESSSPGGAATGTDPKTKPD